MSEKPCYIYLVVGDVSNWPGFDDEPSYGVFKLGVSENPEGRIASLQTSAPFPIEIMKTWRMPSRAHALAIESKFHADHSEFCLYGEWFYYYLAGSEIEVSSTICRYGIDVLRLQGEELVSYVNCDGESRDYARNFVIAESDNESLSA